jgi:aminodeoxyfutalosine synthase
MTTDPSGIRALAAALANGADVPEARLSALASTTDILTLAMAADELRRETHGASVTYVRVADVALPAAGGVVGLFAAAREVRVALPAERLDEMQDALAGVVTAAGAVPVSACSLADLESVALTRGRELGSMCASLRAAGVAAVAEAPIDLLANPDAAWAAARQAGLEVARVTVSRTTDVAGRLALLRRVAALQRSGAGIRSFAPLARSWNAAAPSTGYEDVRGVALARLLLPAVPSIQVDWTLYGPKLAQVALTMGADDLDGVSPADEAPDGRRRAPLEEVRRNIRAAGLTPVERDGLYRRVGA